MSSSSTAAVVVCTASAEREARLLACVRSLLAGTRIPEEVLVVDGNRAVKESVAAWFPPCAPWLRMERRNNSEARNMGLRAAVARLAGNAIPRLLSFAQRRGSPRSSGVAS